MATDSRIATGRTAVVFIERLVLPILFLLVATAPAWSAIAKNVVVSNSRSSSSTSITSPSFSTTSANQLLLAFVSTGAKSAGVTVTGVTGAGLTWVFVKRTNVQMGTSEIWRAFAATTLSGVQVLVSGFPAPLTYVSSTQINAVVPYEVKNLISPFVQVWKGVMKPIALAGMAFVAVAGFLHYIVAGPNEVAPEDEERGRRELETPPAPPKDKA